MDPEKRIRRQSLKVIVSEIIMVVTVIITVIILAFLVSGYWLGSDFKVERQGMLQIYSMPTGANVAVDGDAPWFQRTNTSKVLSSGEHEVVLTKDGYDSWSKTVNISEGLLYRLHYPRLFLLDRKKESVYQAEAPVFATVSPDYNSMLITNNTTDWLLINLNRNNIEPSIVDVSNLSAYISKADDAEKGLFTGKILSANWSNDNEHILMQISGGESSEWLILNVKTPKNSVNITREFATTFDDVRIFDSSASNLLALRNHNLHKIDVATRQVSAIMAENIKSYDFYDSELVFSSDGEIIYSENGSESPKILDQTSPEAKTEVLISRFYEDKYITVVSDNQFTLYRRNNFEQIFTGEISFVPDEVKIGHSGSFVFMEKDGQVAIFDMEIMKLKEWQLDSPEFGWLDSNMLYSIKDGGLIVYDFDGLNRRELSSNVSAHFPVAITDNKWLYYFSDNALVRETIAQ